MVVLHEVGVKASGRVESPLVEAFKEEPARVTKHLGLKDENLRQRGGDDVHDLPSVLWSPSLRINTSSLRLPSTKRRFKYCP